MPGIKDNYPPKEAHGHFGEEFLVEIGKTILSAREAGPVGACRSAFLEPDALQLLSDRRGLSATGAEPLRVLVQ